MKGATGVVDPDVAFIVRRRAERLEEIWDEYEEEPVFDSIRELSSGLVVGAGHLMARIMFIGFSPGADEDEKGLPFTGPSGVVLDELLSTIDKNRHQVYVTNVLKYRLDGANDDPKTRARQVAVSMRYLRREVAVIKPNVLVTLGAEVFSQFEPKKRLVDNHGKILNKSDRSIVPLYHPASVLREPQKRRMLVEDVASVAEALKGYEL
jgi:DNA polymerase